MNGEWSGGVYGGRYSINGVEVAKITQYGDNRYALSILNDAITVYSNSRDALMRCCERKM